MKINDLEQPLHNATLEFLGSKSSDFDEFCRNIADRSQHVIYYGEAHELIRNSPDDILEQADQMFLDDCMNEGLDVGNIYDSVAVRLAYCIEYLTMQKQIKRDLQTLKDQEIENLELESGEVIGLSGLYNELL